MERARVDGIELAYELRGAGAPVVMIHGAQGDQAMFSNPAAAFESRFRVPTFDQRGSASSALPPPPEGQTSAPLIRMKPPEPGHSDAHGDQRLAETREPLALDLPVGKQRAHPRLGRKRYMRVVLAMVTCVAVD